MPIPAAEPTPGIFTPTVQPQATVKFIEEIWPAIFAREITLSELSYHPGCVRFDEIVFLASIAKHLQPKKLFEIGTCAGRTTINLAQNLDQIDAFFTLNLPPDSSCQNDWIEQDKKLFEYSKNMIGKRWHVPPYDTRITQLYGDSFQFDFSPFKEMDLVFIDANKRKEYVLSDSQNAWNMLRPGGMLLWHDYAYCDGVTEAVDEFAKTKNISVTNIYKTTLAVTVK